jgi:hypothetical protein
VVLGEMKGFRWENRDESGVGCTNHGDAAEALRVCDFLVTVFLLPFAFPGRRHASGSFGLGQHVCLG